MGDARFRKHLDRLERADDARAEIARMDDAEIIQALASAQFAQNPYLANVLATEALNRTTRTQAALEHLPVPLLSLDVDLRVSFANPAACAELRWPRDALVGRAFADMHPHHAGLCRLVSPRHGGEPELLIEERLRRADGSSFLAVASCAAILREGEAVGVVIAFRDASEEETTRLALVAMEERHRSFFDALPDAAFSLDLDERIVDVNAAAMRLAGLDGVTLVGAPFSRLVAPEDLARWEALRSAAHAGAREIAALDMVGPGGARRRVRLVAAPERAHGHVVGVHAIAHPLDAGREKS